MFAKFQNRLMLCLLSWSIFSVFSGLLMLTRGAFWKRVGSQFIIWGAIDGAIAVGGQVTTHNRYTKLSPNEDKREIIWRDKQRLKVILWFNVMLDVFYVLGGFRWMNHQSDDNAHKGTGLGIVIQGFFLLVFDLYHVIRLHKLVEPIEEI